MSFTAEELEAMRLADEEIDREFEVGYVPDEWQKEFDDHLDEVAVLERLDHREARARKVKAAYRKFERQAKGEQLTRLRAEGACV